jgi:hypothetical protein
MAKHQKTNQTSVVPATPADGTTKTTTTTNQSPASSNFLSLTGSDIDAMSFSQLDAFVKARRDEVARYGSETKKILKTLTPVIVRMHELLSKNQSKRTEKAEIKRHVHELEQIAEFCKGDTRHSDLLMVVEAMMLCCRAEKSRAVDNAIIYFSENPTYKPPTESEVELTVQTKQPKPVVTDDGPIYDMHTKYGRNKLGRKPGS